MIDIRHPTKDDIRRFEDKYKVDERSARIMFYQDQRYRAIEALENCDVDDLKAIVEGRTDVDPTDKVLIHYLERKKNETRR